MTMLKDHIVGIISDTHDHRDAVRSAVSVFNDAGCSLVVHAGDFVAPFTAGDFGALEGVFVGVYGNNDGERKGLAEQYAGIGALHKPPHEFVHFGMRFAVMHAPAALEGFLVRPDIDVVIYGHTHKIDIRQGKPIVVNPGECCGWLTGRSTVVLLDLLTRRAETVDLDR
jgi:uncharacterized protein